MHLQQQFWEHEPLIQLEWLHFRMTTFKPRHLWNCRWLECADMPCTGSSLKSNETHVFLLMSSRSTLACSLSRTKFRFWVAGTVSWIVRFWQVMRREFKPFIYIRQNFRYKRCKIRIKCWQLPLSKKRSFKLSCAPRCAPTLWILSLSWECSREGADYKVHLAECLFQYRCLVEKTYIVMIFQVFAPLCSIEKT